MRNPTDTLVLLVTCSRDESRRDLAVAVMKNLAQVVPQAGMQDAFAIFDNASLFDDHLQFAPVGTRIIKSSENVGYWSAIKWVLDNRKQIFGRDFKYIYLIESDLYHKDLRPLGSCEAFLAATPTASCVRTQEFSVRHRWRFNKDLSFVPFRCLRSVVRLRSEATGEKAWFRRDGQDKQIWLSNLHAKLPALNRISTLLEVFEDLGNKQDFTERDFFVFTEKRHPHIGVYDGGLFYQISTPQTPEIVSGSWSDPTALKKMGYKTTRTASFVPVQAQPSIERKK